MPKKIQLGQKRVAPGGHSSITFTPGAYSVSISASGITFTAKGDTTLLIGHPPPPGDNEPITMVKEDQFTLPVNDGKQISLLAYQEFTVPDKPPKPLKSTRRR
jgi:hypothetical protein